MAFLYMGILALAFVSVLLSGGRGMKYDVPEYELCDSSCPIDLRLYFSNLWETNKAEGISELLSYQLELSDFKSLLRLMERGFVDWDVPFAKRTVQIYELYESGNRRLFPLLAVTLHKRPDLSFRVFRNFHFRWLTQRATAASTSTETTTTEADPLSSWVHYSRVQAGAALWYADADRYLPEAPHYPPSFDLYDAIDVVYKRLYRNAIILLAREKRVDELGVFVEFAYLQNFRRPIELYAYYFLIAALIQVDQPIPYRFPQDAPEQDKSRLMKCLVDLKRWEKNWRHILPVFGSAQIGQSKTRDRILDCFNYYLPGQKITVIPKGFSYSILYF
ncbi:hypothetical protein H4R33_001383 [Dimargaris cristalligena]|uniref:Uncharacterized protein n=1 Tax=Dimargaris cristalligena TaxID=215637 RepID=A0A4Q0A1F2_9FUNG|nr:hypothetical protein H4R33_001383 [Dimargaris cristalligena]RKP39864.1 hypothetical protein BJ085DRAFT_34622 [Dimargaris cristalligena]|eukprot:RKP39864.1 hypothetical protein BJ085DRAFT_34622 [Dimargaris cristalligena]